MGKQVKFGVDEDPRGYRVVQSAAERVWRKHLDDRLDSSAGDWHRGQ